MFLPLILTIFDQLLGRDTAAAIAQLSQIYPMIRVYVIYTEIYLDSVLTKYYNQLFHLAKNLNTRLACQA